MTECGADVAAYALGSLSDAERLSFEQGAAFPVNYGTAYAALTVMGGMREGDRVLIHAAGGGVGISATQLARNAGAEIFGTASPAKHEAIRAQGILADRYGVAADVWSATSYKELRREALEVERWNLLHPGEPAKKPYVVELFENESGPIVAVSDYMKSVPDQIAPWLPGRFYSLGTDGFGRSDTRQALRRFFEVDAESVVLAALGRLARCGAIEREVAARAVGELGIDPEKVDPVQA